MQSYTQSKFTLAIVLSCVLSSLTSVAIANRESPNKKSLEVMGAKVDNSISNKGLELTVFKSPSSHVGKEKRITNVLLARRSDDK